MEVTCLLLFRTKGSQVLRNCRFPSLRCLPGTKGVRPLLVSLASDSIVVGRSCLREEYTQWSRVRARRQQFSQCNNTVCQRTFCRCHSVIPTIYSALLTTFSAVPFSCDHRLLSIWKLKLDEQASALLFRCLPRVGRSSLFVACCQHVILRTWKTLRFV